MHKHKIPAVPFKVAACTASIHVDKHRAGQFRPCTHNNLLKRPLSQVIRWPSVSCLGGGCLTACCTRCMAPSYWSTRLHHTCPICKHWRCVNTIYCIHSQPTHNILYVHCRASQKQATLNKHCKPLLLLNPFLAWHFELQGVMHTVWVVRSFRFVRRPMRRPNR